MSVWADVDRLKAAAEGLRRRVESFDGWKLLESDGVFFIAERTVAYPWLPPWRRSLTYRSRSAEYLLESIEDANRSDGLLYEDPEIDG